MVIPFQRQGSSGKGGRPPDKKPPAGSGATIKLAA